ncbi:MAG: helix-turn-helix domain-containing protein [Pseudomonadota bacterium]
MELLTTSKAAERLGVSAAFLERDRCSRRLIPYVVIGTRTVRYSPNALDEYIDQQTRRAEYVDGTGL